MADQTPTPAPPDLLGANTPENWARYRESLKRWADQWNQIDRAAQERGPLPESSDALSATFVHHPKFKGKSFRDVMNMLQRAARHAQVLHKLWIKYRKPGQLAEVEQQELAAARIALIDWGRFGGRPWDEMDSRELDRHLQSITQENAGDNLEVDHAVLVQNRMDYEIYSEFEYMQGKKPSLPGYVQFDRDSARHPNETNGQQYLRKSRPFAFGLAVLAFLAAWLFSSPALNTIGFVALGYLILSFPLYPVFLRPGAEKI